MPRERGGLVVAAGQRFGFLNEETGDLDIIHTIDAKLAGTRFNDGKCDPFGRFWAGKRIKTSLVDSMKNQNVIFGISKL